MFIRIIVCVDKIVIVCFDIRWLKIWRFKLCFRINGFFLRSGLGYSVVLLGKISLIFIFLFWDRIKLEGI